MIYFVDLIVTGFVALAMVSAGVPDRWLVPVCVGVFILFAIIFSGSDKEAHA